MLKGGVLFVVFLLFVAVPLSAEEFTDSDTPGTVSIDEESLAPTTPQDSVLDEAGAEFSGAELEQEAGITPDSGFYFVEDKILSQFRNDVENREKKIAEVRAMIEEGNFEAARKALERYKEYANNLEQEADPSQREEARRSAAAIRNALSELQDEIPDDQRQEFVDDVIEQETSIVTAVEVANKIRTLCTQLATLDPLQYEQTCKAGNDGPRWQRELYEDLTAEQKEEARNFVKVMSQCLRTQGEKCDCRAISITAFADKCAEVAPLYAECSKTNNEELCTQADELSEGMEELLPDYLQEIMLNLEGEVQDARYDNHIPEPCREADITGASRDDRERCFKIMIQHEAPEECRAALLEAQIDNPRDARELCEKIMFEEYAPEECVAAGLTDHKECGRYMFEQNAPQECRDAGLTGESPSDGRKCEKIMQDLRGREEFDDKGGPNRGPGQGFGPDCRRIEDAQERLKCYDGALEHAQEFRGELRDEPFEERRGPLPDMPSECEGLTPEECHARFEDKTREEFDDRSEDERGFDDSTSEDINEGETEETSRTESSPVDDESSDSTDSSAGENSGSSTTGSVISGHVTLGDGATNGFLRYFYRFFK